MIRKFAMLVALCALSVIGASSAWAGPSFLHNGTTSENLLPAGSLIGSSTIDGTAVLTSSAGNITCSEASFMANVGASGGSSIAGTLTSLTFGTTGGTPVCTGSGFALGVQACELSASASATATATSHTTGDLTNAAGTNVKCVNGSGTTLCSITVGTGGITGTTHVTYDASGNVTSNALIYNATNLTGTCSFTSPTFKVTFTNIRSGSTTSGPLVALNQTT